jgi:OOP family OmpA-OmpF porin
MRAAIPAACLVALLCLAAAAEEPPALPDPGAPEGAVRTASVERDFDRYALPVAPVGANPAGSLREVAGRVAWSGFRLDDPQASTADVIAGYRVRLREMGFVPLLDCANAACGGFDFRFAVSLLPAPAMLVDTADFAQLSASREEPGGGESVVSVLVSRLLGAIHVQTVAVSPAAPGMTIADSPPPEAGPAAPPLPAPAPAAGLPLLDQLAASGHATVEGIAFEPGTSSLAAASSPALDVLAAALSSQPSLSVLIVGHSDNQGTLDANLALSQRRAEAVRDALVSRGVAAERLEARGVGFLAPVASNATEEGRARNRRVELVLR